MSTSKSNYQWDDSSIYPSDILPGARDVDTPYGSIRIYEWGPEDGMKILFLHGLSTPGGPTFATVAKGIAEKGGCRVCVLDLWGRGYSQAPSDLPHDERLYATQILLAISTSSVSWTGTSSGGFRIIGYSLGGGLTVSFASFFPQLVSSIVVMAPGGLYRKLPPSYNRLPIKYPRFFPLPYVKRCLGQLLVGDSKPYERALEADGEQEANSKGEPNSKRPSPATQRSRLLDINAIVKWQIDHKKDFIHSVTSSLRVAPIVNQHHTWTRLGNLLSKESSSRPTEFTRPNRLCGSRVLLILGCLDEVVDNKQTCADARHTLGADNVQIVYINDGGHNFPMTNGEEVVEVISKFWNL